MSKFSRLPKQLRDKILEVRQRALELARFSKLACNGKLISLPMDSLTDEFAFSFGTKGWNFYCALLEEFAEGSSEITPEQSQFRRFFENEQIRSIRTIKDLLFVHDPPRRSNSPEFYLGTYPWGGITKTSTINGGIPFGWYYDQVEGTQTKRLWTYGRNLWYEPGDSHTLKVEWELTLKVYMAIKDGYFPLRYLDYPTVALLIRENGEQLGLNVDGHHRLGVLSYLGYKQVRVEVTEVVKESEVDQWYYVKNGYCTREQALDIFNAFFEINGKERIKYLGLQKLETAKPRKKVFVNRRGQPNRKRKNMRSYL